MVGGTGWVGEASFFLAEGADATEDWTVFAAPSSHSSLRTHYPKKRSFAVVLRVVSGNQLAARVLAFNLSLNNALPLIILSPSHVLKNNAMDF